MQHAVFPHDFPKKIPKIVVKYSNSKVHQVAPIYQNHMISLHSIWIAIGFNLIHILDPYERFLVGSHLEKYGFFF